MQLFGNFFSQFVFMKGKKTFRKKAENEEKYNYSVFLISKSITSSANADWLRNYHTAAYSAGSILRRNQYIAKSVQF